MHLGPCTPRISAEACERSGKRTLVRAEPYLVGLGRQRVKIKSFGALFGKRVGFVDERTAPASTHEGKAVETVKLLDPDIASCKQPFPG
jgi:hypothetical protein